MVSSAIKIIMVPEMEIKAQDIIKAPYKTVEL